MTDEQMLETFKAGDRSGIEDFQRALGHLMERASYLTRAVPVLRHFPGSSSWRLMSHGCALFASGKDLESLARDLFTRYPEVEDTP